VPTKDPNGCVSQVTGDADEIIVPCNCSDVLTVDYKEKGHPASMLPDGHISIAVISRVLPLSLKRLCQEAYKHHTIVAYISNTSAVLRELVWGEGSIRTILTKRKHFKAHERR
jgi:hypothetical protein